VVAVVKLRRDKAKVKLTLIIVQAIMNLNKILILKVQVKLVLARVPKKILAERVILKAPKKVQ
jgi:hypothetical protein